MSTDVASVVLPRRAVNRAAAISRRELTEGTRWPGGRRSKAGGSCPAARAINLTLRCLLKCLRRCARSQIWAARHTRKRALAERDDGALFGRREPSTVESNDATLRIRTLRPG